MKKILFAALALALVASCGPQKMTKISGLLPEGSNSVRIVSEDEEIDTTLTAVDGKFTYELPTDETLLLYAFADGRQVPFVADGSKIDINFEEGLATSSSKDGVQSRLSEYVAWNDDFMTDFREKTSKEDLSDEEKEEIYETAFEEYNNQLEKFARENSDNLVGLIAVSNLNLDDDARMLDILNGLSDELKEKPHIKAMLKALDASSKTAEGQMFTDFEVNGVKFSDFIGKGKYILVDFWASWCGPCRGEMPNLRNVYEKYHGDKFDMLSVAVWDKLEDTQKAAEEENIVWNQIVDAQRIPTDLYGIQGIPHIILFGPDGTILKRNLRGDAIGEAVAEALAE